MKRLNHLLNIIIGTSVGVLIGKVIFQILDYKKYPELYAVTSAPWYTSIILYGAVTLVVVFIAGIVKLIIRKKIR